METNNINNDLIGSGPLFPIQLTPDNQGNIGWHVVRGDIQLIDNNITSLLNYEIGQRLRQEDFGTRLWECIEEPNTQAQAFLIKGFIQEALNNFEDRIKFKASEVYRDGSTLTIVLHYIIKATGTNRSSTISYTY
jgi:phage baseplate assembly protein W